MLIITSAVVLRSQVSHVGRDIFFSDVTVTDNYVVASTSRTNMEGCYLKMFDKTATGFISYPVNTNYITRVADSLANGESRITAAKGDTLALSYLYHDNESAGSSLDILEISSLSPNVIPIVALYLIQSDKPKIDPLWKIRSMRYNPVTLYLTLAMDMNNPLTGLLSNVMAEFKISNPIINTLYTHSIKGYVFNDVDNWSTISFMSVGHNTIGDFSLFRKQCSSPSGCADYNNYKLYDVEITPNIINLPETNEKASITSNIYNPQRYFINVDLICKD